MIEIFLLMMLILLLIPLLYIGGNILYAAITKFRPAPVEAVEPENSKAAKSTPLKTGSVVKLLTWNTGYSGLGADVDFFLDGGKMSVIPDKLVKKYIRGIYKILKSFSGHDFIFLQEVDIKSKRSRGINMVEGIKKRFPKHCSLFAKNYDVKFLPYPWTKPLGKIKGGILSLSKYKPAESLRIAFPGIKDFPRKLFYLQRCMLLSRYKLRNKKELIVINIHLEAYDEGEVKKEQMKLMKKWATAEYKKGNYVIIGGDWNIAPADFDVHKWEKEKNNEKRYLANNDARYIKGWRYVYDPKVPTNRKNDKPLHDKTFRTIIDYFMVSPNVEVIEVKGINQNFQNSDHNPVAVSVRLK